MCQWMMSSGITFSWRLAESEEIVQAPLGQLTWYHHFTLLDKLDSRELRLAYARLAAENGWSRNVMVHLLQFFDKSLLQFFHGVLWHSVAKGDFYTEFCITNDRCIIPERSIFLAVQRHLHRCFLLWIIVAIPFAEKVIRLWPGNF